MSAPEPTVVVVLLKPCGSLNSFESGGYPASFAEKLVKRGDAMYPETFAQMRAEEQAKKAQEAAVEAKRLADKAEAQRREAEKQAKQMEKIRQGEDPGVPQLPDAPPASKDVKAQAVVRR